MAWQLFKTVRESAGQPQPQAPGQTACLMPQASLRASTASTRSDHAAPDRRVRRLFFFSSCVCVHVEGVGELTYGSVLTLCADAGGSVPGGRVGGAERKELEKTVLYCERMGERMTGSRGHVQGGRLYLELAKRMTAALK